MTNDREKFEKALKALTCVGGAKTLSEARRIAMDCILALLGTEKEQA